MYIYCMFVLNGVANANENRSPDLEDLFFFFAYNLFKRTANTVAEWFRIFILVHEVTVNQQDFFSRVASGLWCKPAITKLLDQFGKYTG